MARRLALLAGALALAALLAWRLDLLGPLVGPAADGPTVESDAPVLTDGPTAPDAAAPGALAGGPRPAAPRAKPHEVRGPRVTGLVADREGHPVAGARVVSLPDTLERPVPWAQAGAEGGAGFEATTEEDGRFTVAVAPDAPFHTVAAEAAGYGPTWESGVRAGADLRLVLERPGVLHGTVIDADGSAVVGARIQVVGLLDVLQYEGETRSGPGGAYRLEGLPAPGRPTASRTSSSIVFVTAEGYAPLTAPGITGLAPGKELLRDFVLVRGSAILGKVVEGGSGAPVEGARVVLWSVEGGGGGPSRPGVGSSRNPWAPRALSETTTAADGSFTLDHVPAQGFHPLVSDRRGRRGPTVGGLGAMKAGYLSATADDEVPFLRDGARFEVTLTMWPAALVSGRVVDASAQPVAKASVWAQTQDSFRSWLPLDLYPDAPMATATTDAEGKYRLAAPASREGGTATTVVGRLPVRPETLGFVPWKPDGDGSVSVTAKAGETVVAPDLVLSSSAGAIDGILSVAVLVTAKDGTPVWGATVAPPWDAGSRTGPDGRATILLSRARSSQWASSLPLVARAKGFAPGIAMIPSAGLGPDPVRIVLEPGHRAGGRVLAADRTPVAYAAVRAGDGSMPVPAVFPETRFNDGTSITLWPASSRSPLGALWGYTTADEEGRFLLEDLPAGPYHLAAYRARPTSMRRKEGVEGRAVLSGVAADVLDAELVMPFDDTPPTGGVEGVVVDAATGRPVPGVSAQLRRGDVVGGSVAAGSPGLVSTVGPLDGYDAVPSPGRFVMAAVPAGTWTLVASGEGYSPGSVEGVLVRAGETTEVPPVALVRGTTVRGRVRLPEGVSATDRALNFALDTQEPGKVRYVSTLLAPDATYRQSGFTPGTWRVYCYPTAGYNDSKQPRPTLIAARSDTLVVGEGDSDVEYGPTLWASGTLQISPSDDRFPPPPWQGGTGVSEAQKRFAEGCRIVVRDADGTVVGEQRGGIVRGFAGSLGFLLVLPGRYTARLEMPGDEVREETVTVAAGGQISVTLARKGP